MCQEFVEVEFVEEKDGEAEQQRGANYAYNLINFLFLFLIKGGPLSVFVNGTLCTP